MEQATPNKAHPVGPRWRRLRRELLIILFLTAFAIAITWPLVTRMTTEIVGGTGDSHLFYWNYWWFNHALFELRQSPFFCPLQLYPYGADLAFHTLCPFNCLLALPFQKLFGIPFAYNLVILFSLVAAAYTAHRLAFDLTGDRVASVAAGIMFGFSPYMLMRATGHMNLIGAWPLPLVALFAMRAFKSGNYRSAFLAGVFTGLQLWISMYYTLFAGILFVLLWISVLLSGRSNRRRLYLCPAFAGVGAVTVASPILVVMLRSMTRSGAFLSPARGASFGEGVDLLGFFVPSEINVLFGKWTYPIYARLYGGHIEALAFGGFLCLISSIIAVRLVWDKRTRVFAALALLFAVVALGDRLHVCDIDSVMILGKRLIVPLPAMVLKFVPILNMIRVSSRFVIIFQLALICLAAQGLAYLRRRVPGSRRTFATALVFAFLLLDLSCVPYFSQSLRQDKLNRVLKQVPGKFSVMHLPFWAGSAVGWIGLPCGDTISWSAAQMVHHKPILRTLASRVDPRVLELLQASPLINAIVLAQSGELTEDALEELTPEIITKELQHFKLKLLVAHRWALDPSTVGQLAYLFRHMGFKLLYRNDEVAVIETPLGPSLEEFVPKPREATRE